MHRGLSRNFKDVSLQMPCELAPRLFTIKIASHLHGRSQKDYKRY